MFGRDSNDSGNDVMQRCCVLQTKGFLLLCFHVFLSLLFKAQVIHADAARKGFWGAPPVGDHLALLSVYNKWKETNYNMQWLVFFFVVVFCMLIFPGAWRTMFSTGRWKEHEMFEISWRACWRGLRLSRLVSDVFEMYLWHVWLSLCSSVFVNFIAYKNWRFRCFQSPQLCSIPEIFNGYDSYPKGDNGWIFLQLFQTWQYWALQNCEGNENEMF